MVKDANKPKGPMTAYACFIQVIREEHKKKHPNEPIVFSELSKKCGEKWKMMTPKEKKRFEDMSEMDKDRYNREMSDYMPPDGVPVRGKKRKQVKDPAMPKRSWSAFFFFSDEFRPQLREAHPSWRVGEIAKELGHLWENCKDKSKYEAMAQEDKLRYEKEMTNYRAGTYVPVPKQAKVPTIPSPLPIAAPFVPPPVAAMVVSAPVYSQQDLLGGAGAGMQHLSAAGDDDEYDEEQDDDEEEEDGEGNE